MTDQLLYNMKKGQTVHGKKAVVVKTASFTLSITDSGKIFLIDGAASVIVTLPPTQLGLEYTIIVKQLPASGAGSAFSPAAVDQIIGNGFTPADDKDAINTAATDVIGDWLTVVGDGAAGWYITSVKGIWAREA